MGERSEFGQKMCEKESSFSRLLKSMGTNPWIIGSHPGKNCYF